ncbi:DNA-processing protein DprA [Pandoraea terrae]|nr:DNA-processing protein DprA [Pandoraea terrae]
MMKNFSTAPLSAQIAAPAALSSHAVTAGVRASAGEIRDWLRLTLTPELGAAAVRRLLAAFGVPARVFAQSAEVLARVVPAAAARRILAPPTPATVAQITRTVAWAAQPGCAVLTLADSGYPPALLALPDPPPVLYCLGDTTRLARDMVAIVGSRRATPQGTRNAAAFAQALGERGLTIVSGLARGIDAAAHEGSLATPGGTVAVVGTGVDVVYPPSNGPLTARISQAGAVISEFALGTPPRPDHFPRRNRLIAALGRVTLVIEAAQCSGSLITARLAAELGRDVLALPGSIHAPQSAGCHALIRDGATLAAAPDDILEALGWPATPPRPPGTPDTPARPAAQQDTAGADAVLEALGYDPVSIDTLCTRTAMSAADMQQRLVSLELDAQVARLPGGRYQRIV